MKKSVFIFGIVNTILIIVFGILILKKVNRCCGCNEKRETIFVGHTAEVYDSLTHKKGISASMDRLSIGEKGDTILTTFDLGTTWYCCPEKEVKEALAIIKKSSYTKKVTKTATTKVVPEKVMSVVKEEPVKEDVPSQTNVTNVSNTFIEAPKTLDTLNPILSDNSDSLKVEVFHFVGNESPYRGYYKNLVLPSVYDEKRSVLIYDYDFNQNYELQNHIKKAKTHLWIGTSLATVGALGFTSSMFCDVPTFVEYNGLGAFDPTNKYYAHNIHQRERLRTLKWVRGASVVVGILGGTEIVYGIHLLKDADLELTPESISFKVTF